MKKYFQLSLIIIFCLSILLFVSCGDNKTYVKYWSDSKVILSVETSGNSAIAMPDDPIKEGKQFDGWYIGLECKTPFTVNYVIQNKITSTLNVYAKFVDDNGLKNSEIATINLKKDENGNYYDNVGSAISYYSFLGEVKVAQGAKYSISTSATPSETQLGKTVALNEGDNEYYIHVTSATGEVVSYKVTIYRNHNFVATFEDEDGSIITTSVVEEGKLVPKPQDPTKNGYIFDGWDYDFSQPTTKNITITASWKLATYTITYHNVEDATHTNKTSYTIISDTITLSDAIPNDSKWVFNGWYSDANYKNQISQIQKGSYGNLDIYASYKGQYKITFDSINNYTCADISVASGEEISEPTIPSQYQLTGYKVNYYTDIARTEEYEFTTMPGSNLTIYPCFDYVANGLGFFPYLEEFTSSNISIDSDEEFQAYIEYIGYYDITKGTDNSGYFTVSYLTGGSDFASDPISLKIDELYKSMTYSSTGGLGKSRKTENSTYKYKLYVSSSKRSVEATLTTASSGYSKCGNIAYVPNTQTRANNYEGFALNSVMRSIDNVQTTNQLVYVVEHGYKPICVSGSSAEQALNNAKVALRQSINDDMNDVEKCKAVYDWLVNNVSYDYNVLDVDQQIFIKYDAYYLEGVFNNHKAVCDGISKAFGLLAKIDGLPAVRVVGINGSGTVSNHAWNKVLVDCNWYVVDATWGASKITLKNNNDVSTVYESHTYEHFMITDAKKVAGNCRAVSYADIVCNTSYDFYANYKVSTTQSLVVSSRSDIAKVLDYYADYYTNYGTSYQFILVQVEMNYLFDSVSTEFSNAKTLMTKNKSFTFYANSAVSGGIGIVYIKRT